MNSYECEIRLKQGKKIQLQTQQQWPLYSPFIAQPVGPWGPQGWAGSEGRFQQSAFPLALGFVHQWASLAYNVSTTISVTQVSAIFEVSSLPIFMIPVILQSLHLIFLH